MLSFTAIRDVLQRSRSIAIVGAKDKAGQPVDRVGRYLLDKGYTIFPVHPVRKTVWGLTAYPDLASLPQPVDIIDLFRAPQYCPAHAQEVLALPWKPLCFWMQEGIRSAEARALLEPEQILVVEDGRIAESGTHDELVKQNGVYRRFTAIREQAEGWRIAAE